jgi:hypothetical protein
MQHLPGHRGGAQQSQNDSCQTIMARTKTNASEWCKHLKDVRLLLTLNKREYPFPNIDVVKVTVERGAYHYRHHRCEAFGDGISLVVDGQEFSGNSLPHFAVKDKFTSQGWKIKVIIALQGVQEIYRFNQPLSWFQFHFFTVPFAHACSDQTVWCNHSRPFFWGVPLSRLTTRWLYCYDRGYPSHAHCLHKGGSCSWQAATETPSDSLSPIGQHSQVCTCFFLCFCGINGSSMQL